MQELDRRHKTYREIRNAVVAGARACAVIHLLRSANAPDNDPRYNRTAYTGRAEGLFDIRNRYIALEFCKRIDRHSGGSFKRPQSIHSRQKFLNRAGDNSVYRKVCWIFLCLRYACNALVSCPLFASA
jgi:hypothetical protein